MARIQTYIVCYPKKDGRSADLNKNLLFDMGFPEIEQPLVVSPLRAAQHAMRAAKTVVGASLPDNMQTVAVEIELAAVRSQRVGRQDLKNIDGLMLNRCKSDLSQHITDIVTEQGFEPPKSVDGSLMDIDVGAVVWLVENHTEFNHLKYIAFAGKLQDGIVVNCGLILDTSIVKEIVNLANSNDVITSLT